MSEIRRIEKGPHEGEQKGEGSTFIIPASDVPDGLVSGEKAKIILEGLVNLDDQGATVLLDRIYFEKSDDRGDAMQNKLEKELTISIK
mgnify:CR=1 FL=1